MTDQVKKPAEIYRENALDEELAMVAAAEFCSAARVVYQLWKREGSGVLRCYLRDEVGCSDWEAKTIASFYSPQNAPVEICPISVLSSGKDFHRVFEDLSLTLPSINTEGGGVWPKHLLAWVLIRHVRGLDNFQFDIQGTGKIRDNKILFPNLICGPSGGPIPLGLAALGVVKMGELPVHVVKKAGVLTRAVGDVGIQFAKALFDAEIIFPPDRILKGVVDVIERGLAGEEIVITGAFCPDYAYRSKYGYPGQYEYTFENIGSGVGLVAQQFVRVLPVLVNFFERHGIHYQVKLGIGDFEANSSEILQSVAVSRDEFVDRCSMSLQAFQQALPDISMELVLFEQGSNGRWSEYTEAMKASLQMGNYGWIKEVTGKNPEREVEFIAKSGLSFYRRWYKRPEMEVDEAMELVIAQGAEYCAMGKILAEDFRDKPLLQIAGDRPKMQIFNSHASRHPTLCCKRIY